jgi:hypothetical protein
MRKLAERKDKNKTPFSVMHGSAKQDDNPYCGVEAHHLGRIPLGFVWMWPELRDATSLDVTGTGSSGSNYSNSGSWGNLGGRLRGLPFMYSQRENWIRISRALSMLNTMMRRAADPKIITDSQTAKFDGKITRLEPGEDYKYDSPPPMPQEGLQLLKEMQAQVDAATFAPAARGAQAGTSGSQQRETYAAGTVRLDAVTTEIERCLQQYLYGVGATMLERGPEKLNVAGKGRGYNVKGPYAMEYSSLDRLKGAIPVLEVSIKSTNGLKNTEAVALFTNLATKSLLPFKMLVEQILDEPNGDMIKEELLDEKAQTEKETIQPRIDIAAKKALLEAFDETWKLDDDLEKKSDQKELEMRQAKLAQDISQLPMEQQYQIQNQMLQQLMQIMGMNQGNNPGSALGMGAATGGMGPGAIAPPQPPMPSPGGSGPGMGPGGMSDPPMAPGMPPMGQPPAFSPPPMMPPRPPMPGPGAPGVSGPGPEGQFATAPGQADRALEPLTAGIPIGGTGRPGVDSALVGPQGLPAQAAFSTPALAAANAALRPPTLPPVTTSAATARNKRNSRRRK